MSHDNVVRFFDATNASRIKQMLAASDSSDDSDDSDKPKKKARKEAFFDGL